MKIQYPVSFFVMISAIVVTATVSVVWSMTHILVLAADCALIAALRAISHMEKK